MSKAMEASMSSAVSTIGQIAMHVDMMDKRSVSEVASPPHRVGILRARITPSIGESANVSAVPKSPFKSPQSPFVSTNTSSSPDASLPALEAFPFGLRGSASGTTQFVSAGVLASTGLALGIHDGVAPKDTSGQGVDVSAESMTGIEKMMRKLLQEQKEDTKRDIEAAIAQHCQPLTAAIAQERTTRTQAISEVQSQISDLRLAFEAFSANSASPPRDGGTRTNEIVIGGFGLKSKQGAINLVEKIIDGKPGEPKIIMDRVSFTPTVIPIKFSSNDYAEQFVQQHSGNQQFPNRYDGFWCNISKTPEERAHFKKHLDPLFKAKRALCSTMNLDGTQVVVNKITKKVYYVEGFELRLICEYLPIGIMRWSPDVIQTVQDAYTILMESR